VSYSIKKAKSSTLCPITSLSESKRTFFFERFPYSMFVPSMSWQNDQFQHEKWRKTCAF
jgi:hypothetical protein